MQRGKRFVLVVALVAGVLAMITTPERAQAASGGDAIALCRQVVGSTPEVGERACRTAEQFTRGLANACRNLHKADTCQLVDGRVASPAHMAAYEKSWVHKALTLQRRLADSVALSSQVIPHTHNSFNSPTYAPPTLSNLDPNQIYSMYDQLRMGIRAIEMDIHWTPSLYGSRRTGLNAVTLCHGNVNQGIHIGCAGDRAFSSGLAELRAWLTRPGNEDEVVLLYLQNELDGIPTAHDLASKAIAKYLGDLVERPAAGKPCADLPTTTSPAQIRARGHRVLITGNCGPGAWGSWVHSRGSSTNWNESSSGPGNDYVCGANRTSPNAIVRWYEDSTLVSALTSGSSGALTPIEAKAMANCGANLIGFDQLTPEDPRLAAVVWSWARNQPANRSPACAVSTRDTYFHAGGCDGERAFACASSPDTWRVTTTRSRFANGRATCAAIGSGFRFAVPRNGLENSFLRRAAGNQDVWVNYADTSGRGDWRA